MARAKNRGYQQKLSPSYTIRRWRLGEYIRLSKEDLKKSKDYKDDSNSVKNQRDLLNDFYQMHIDEFESVAEYDTYGDEAACIIVDERGKLVLDDVYNGFDDDTLRLLDLEVKEVPEMPDPALSVQNMKDYGYAWAGVLPAGQEAAEKALEKGCEVYRLYSDNTEGLCVDAKEIADHAAKGGMLGISKESWMAALEKENYLKATEMSMEDDYGMIDGIINNGPKEDKTLDAKAPETREKSSIMDRLKAAKGVKQKECCPPKKHKGEIEL